MSTSGKGKASALDLLNIGAISHTECGDSNIERLGDGYIHDSGSDTDGEFCDKYVQGKEVLYEREVARRNGEAISNDVDGEYYSDGLEREACWNAVERQYDSGQHA